MVRFRTIFTCFAAFTFWQVTADSSSARDAAIKLNIEAFHWAAALIMEGHVVADKKGGWSNSHPSRAREDEFVRDHGFDEYAKWHLAVNERHAKNSKARYKFPFGDFRSVHRSGLLAVKARAHEYGYQEVENAAAKLLELIESARPAGQKRVN